MSFSRPFDDLDRLLGAVDGDVHVHAEDELAPRDVLELVDERAVAVARRDPLALEQAERVRPRGADAQAASAGDVAHGLPQRAQRGLGLADVLADRRRDLDCGLHQLGVDLLLVLVAEQIAEDGVDVLDEVERLGIEQHVLLLDAERVRVARPELVLDDAAGMEDPLDSGDRRRVRLLGHASRTIVRSAPSDKVPEDQHDRDPEDDRGRQLGHDLPLDEGERPEGDREEDEAVERHRDGVRGHDPHRVGNASAHPGAEPVVERLGDGEGGEAADDDPPGSGQEAEAVGADAVHLVHDRDPDGEDGRPGEAHRDHDLGVLPALAPGGRGVVGGLDQRQREPDQVGPCGGGQVRERQLHDLVRAHLSGYYDPDVQARQDRELPVHLRTASTSISTSQRGSARSQTIPVHAGRALPNTSPCTGST